jgi:hypothetical protein
MAQFVQADVIEAGAGADAPPWMLQVGQARALLPAGDHPGVLDGTRGSPTHFRSKSIGCPRRSASLCQDSGVAKAIEEDAFLEPVKPSALISRRCLFKPSVPTPTGRRYFAGASLVNRSAVCL